MIFEVEGVKLDYFRIIPDNFFSLLASKNKRTYLALIIQAFKVYESGSILGIEKKIVCDELVNYLDTNTCKYEVEDADDEEANANSNRDLANYVLRRMEECGWIDVDVTNDYEEILNFSDAGITICEAILSMSSVYYEEGSGDYAAKDEYQGYIYTIYSLLYNPENLEYSVTMQEIYRNTKLLLRAIRKLDSRIKEYISSVFTNTDVKELMENLVMYRQDFVESGYAKLKMSDNINRYRLRIVTKLEDYQNSEEIMQAITMAYKKMDPTEALLRANRDIDEIIDVFNSLDSLISMIDEKSKNYINATIAKIKFLVSEDDNVIGKLNRILKYIKDENQTDHIERALKQVNQFIKLESRRSISENSLYYPRGSYKRNFNLLLDDTRLQGFDIETDFFNAYQAPYREDVIKEYLENKMFDNKLVGGDLLPYAADANETMLIIYVILYALENEERYEVIVLDNKIRNQYLVMRDFMIRRKGEK